MGLHEETGEGCGEVREGQGAAAARSGLTDRTQKEPVRRRALAVPQKHAARRREEAALPCDIFPYISPRSLLRPSMQAPTAPARSPSFESLIVVSLFTSCREYLLMALLSGSMM